MKKVSTGILLYKLIENKTLFYLVHPGGPFWTKKDLGAWSLPKGEVDNEEKIDDENFLIENAIRELEEEVGVKIENKNLIPLGSVKMKSGKIIHAWAAEYVDEIIEIKSNFTEIEWPPKSGKKIKIPEVDKGEWFKTEDAKEKINPTQSAFIDRFKLS